MTQLPWLPLRTLDFFTVELPQLCLELFELALPEGEEDGLILPGLIRSDGGNSNPSLLALNGSPAKTEVLLWTQSLSIGARRCGGGGGVFLKFIPGGGWGEGGGGGGP